MIFNKKYTIENRREFLNFLRIKLFGDKLIEDIRPILIDRKTLFFDENNCFELGKITLDKELSIFEIKQKSKHDPRITLTRDAFKIMESKWIQNALFVFYSEDSSSWRFSLLTLKKTWWEVQSSNPKRYSFLLWEGEKTKTPERYLNHSIKDFADLVSRFDVEVVRKEFFDDYITLYIRLYKAITEDADFITLLNYQKIEVVSFTKNLLGKIVFLYFIQKKWWLWVPRDGKYGEDGDKNFMRSLWNDFSTWEKSILEKHGYFYNDYLEWLFFAGLNKDNSDNDDYNEYFNQKVPYLNGWLFKEDYVSWRENISKISNDIFSNDKKDGILDIFDLYNFTIDEDDLYDSEIAIDPEMLGRIFEKMISISHENIDKIVIIYEKKNKIEINKEFNKKFWAFYTPREIVHYMTKESIIAYLLNNLKGKKEENEEKIRILFDLKEKFLVTKSEITEEVFDKIANIIEEIDVLLKKVKILDPAIGSGAFPMGILHEISSIRYYIYGVFYETFGINTDEFKDSHGKISMYKIKRNIIGNNIYGVDISAGAIDIARLRFWLSLVVDEEIPEPLPNFEFKFVCANTLIPLAEESNQKNLELEWAKELKVETLRKYMLSYYNAQWIKEKENWKNRIENFLWIGKNIALDLYKTKSERTKQLETYEPFNSNHSAEFFDPSLMMGNSKFDIAIGNPPYIKEYNNRNAFDWIRDHEYYMGKMDIWYFFSCYTLDLLKEGWVQSFIAQNNWITSFWAKIMRNKILEDAKIKEFIDFGDYKVFENVGIQTMIYILEKTKNNQKYEVKYSKLENKDFNRKHIDEFLYAQWGAEDYKKHFSKIEKIKYLNKTIDFVDDEKDKILEKMLKYTNFRLTEKEVIQWIVYPQDFLNNKKNKLLWNKFNIWEGIFVLSDQEKENLKLDDFEKQILKPDYSTEEIGRYFANDKNKKWVIYTDSSFKDISKISNYPNIKKHLDKFKDVITSDNKPYWLHRSRDEKFFIWEKIIMVRKCDKPAFSYVDFDSYVSATFYVIKTDRINQIFLTWLLNSTLIEFWLKNKWKMQWNNYQLDKEPLVNLPLISTDNEQQNKMVNLVEKILDITKQPFYGPKNPPKEQKDLENEIDAMVYELYGLTEEEIQIVKESLK